MLLSVDSFRYSLFSPSHTSLSFLSPSLSFFLQSSISPRKILTAHRAMTASSAQNSGERCSLSKLAPLEAVLFDIDGTLCDSDAIHYDAFHEMLQEIGYNGGIPITEQFYVENFSGKHNDGIARFLFPEDFERGVKFMEDKEAMFRRLAVEKLQPVSGLKKVTKWIEERGLKRAAVTNAPRANAELMISILGLGDFFQFLIVGSECARAKPYPDPYLKGLEVLKASKDHTFIFEDSFSGIQAGVAAGMPVVGICTRNPEDTLLAAQPSFLIKNYDDEKLWEALGELDTKGGAPQREG